MYIKRFLILKIILKNEDTTQTVLFKKNEHQRFIYFIKTSFNKIFCLIIC